VDDTTLTELLPRGSQQTHMQTFLHQLHTWATPNKMEINFMKTKKMILGSLEKFSPQHLSDSSANNPVTVERVQQFKLLGITISHDMNWQTHIDSIITKASSRLYFLKILKKVRSKFTSTQTLLSIGYKTDSRILLCYLASRSDQCPGRVTGSHSTPGT